MVRPNKFKNKTYLHNGRIIQHLQKVAGDNDFNRFITFSFTYSRYGSPLNKSDVLLVSRLVSAFFNTVSEKLNGRKRKSDKDERPKVPAIGFPEYRTENNGKTFLHYHCLIRIPDEKLDYFNEIAKRFWKKVVKNTIGYPPTIDNKSAYAPKVAAFYSNKYIEDGFTLENSIFHGISLK